MGARGPRGKGLVGSQVMAGSFAATERRQIGEGKGKGRRGKGKTEGKWEGLIGGVII